MVKMELRKPAVAGSMESGDVLITLRPNDGGLALDIQSNVKALFGDAIEATIREVLEEAGVTGAEVAVIDKGALDVVIRSRMQCAVQRAAGLSYNWTREDAHG